MKLADYMSREGIKPEEMAALIGDASVSGVVKWMREERIPRADQQRRIFEATGGRVSPNDFVLGASKASAA